MVTERLIIRGSLASADFPGWIIHRACRLGLQGGIVRIGERAIETLVTGPAELIDAMEVGCSLGPISVQVDRIDRFPVDVPVDFPADVVDRPFDYINGDLTDSCLASTAT